MLGLIRRNNCFYLSDSHIKNEHGQTSIAGAAILIKFETLFSFENYTKSFYYTNYPGTL